MSGASVSSTSASSGSVRPGADLQRALEGHARRRSPAAKPRSTNCAACCRAAVEGVGDAARHLDAAQALQQRVGRAAHVQDHRQAGVARQLQLREVEALLARAVQAGHEVVEADLAHRHQARVVAVARKRLRQPVEVVVGARVHEQRVDAQRVGQAQPVRQRAHGVEVRRLATAGSTSMPTPAARARAHHGVAVGVELGASRWQWESIHMPR
jgi:hypothetical protein